MLKLEIKTGGSAFGYEDDEFADYDKRHEIARLLRKVAEQIEGGFTEKKIIDINGNKCGEWKLD